MEINTLADVLNACTATSGGVEGDGSACGVLFTATDVASGNIRVPCPTDTLQAAFNIAQHPVTDWSTMCRHLNLPTSSSPFQPILTTQPIWSLTGRSR